MLSIISVKFQWPSSKELFYNIDVQRGEIVEGEKSVMAAEEKFEFEKYNIVSWIGG